MLEGPAGNTVLWKHTPVPRRGSKTHRIVQKDDFVKELAFIKRRGHCRLRLPMEDHRVNNSYVIMRRDNKSRADGNAGPFVIVLACNVRL